MRTWWTTGQHPWVKFVELFLVANAVAAVASLVLAPGSEEWFTWTIAPDASARLLAVMYANAVVLGVVALRQPDWAHARAIVVLITLFAVAATAMTFFHLDPFLAHPWHHLAYWLGGYAVLVLSAPAVLVVQERRHGGRLPVSVPLSPLQRATAVAAAAAMGLASAALLADPAWFSRAWPWDVVPLTGRLLGVWLGAFASAYLYALWDGDWQRVRPLFLAAPITGLLLALVPLLHTGDLRPGAGIELAVYYALTAAVAAPGLGLLAAPGARRPQRRHDRAKAVPSPPRVPSGRDEPSTLEPAPTAAREPGERHPHSTPEPFGRDEPSTREPFGRDEPSTREPASAATREPPESDARSVLAAAPRAATGTEPRR